MQVLTPAQWEFAFVRVLFPMLRKLLEMGGSTGKSDQGREKTRLMAALMLSNVFLHHLGPLSSLPTFTALWLSILELVGQFCSIASTDILAETLKNMVLVIDTRALFFTESGHLTPLWGVTWGKIDTFLPGLREELFPGWESPLPRDVSKLQSLTVSTLGKKCLQNEEQAKKIIPTLGQILDTNEDPSIKNIIIYALTDMCVMYASLVDPLLCLRDKSLNDYQHHASYNKFVVSAMERKVFNLSGDEMIDESRTLYRFKLDSMKDKQRFQTILGGVVEGTVTLSPASLSLLRDTFYCLVSDSIKLASLKSKEEEEAETEQDMERRTIISGVVKKNVMENIMPIIVALKHKLESVKSPLVSDLFKYLCKLMEDYKNEVTENLAADEQLAKENEFDLRRYEQEQVGIKEREVQDRLARKLRYKARQGTPLASAPGTSQSSTPGTTASICVAGSHRSGSAYPVKEGFRPELIMHALHNALTQTAKKPCSLQPANNLLRLRGGSGEEDDPETNGKFILSIIIAHALLKSFI